MSKEWDPLFVKSSNEIQTKMFHIFSMTSIGNHFWGKTQRIKRKTKLNPPLIEAENSNQKWTRNWTMIYASVTFIHKKWKTDMILYTGLRYQYLLWYKIAGKRRTHVYRTYPSATSNSKCFSSICFSFHFAGTSATIHHYWSIDHSSATDHPCWAQTI